MKEIILQGIYGTKATGRVVLVDDEDYEWLNQWKWHLGGKYRQYARRTDTKTENGIQSFTAVWMHRLILGVEDPKIKADHKDGDTLNNQRYNLREATTSQNAANKKPKRVYKGIKRVSDSHYVATCIKDGKHHRERYNTEIEAAIGYNTMAIKLFGEYAKLNIII